jgi:ABC-type phosphate transport system auxiliary subunit
MYWNLYFSASKSTGTLGPTILEEVTKEDERDSKSMELAEQVLNIDGSEYKISKISEEKLRKILEGVRRLRKRQNKNKIEEVGEDNRQKEEIDISIQ